MKKKNRNTSMEYDYLQASSSQDFTGLIPAGTADEGELIEYDEIFPFYPKIPTDKKE